MRSVTLRSVQLHTNVPRFLRLFFINSVAMSHAMPNRVRRSLLRRLGVRVGDAWFASGSHLRGVDLSVDHGSRINHRVFFDAGPVAIARNVSVGVDVKFLSVDHALGDERRRAAAHHYQPITVGDGVWLGAGATIMGGVQIAEGCVIGAGAVVTSDTRPHALYAGVPAVWKRDLPVDGKDAPTTETSLRRRPAASVRY
jgi:maltose O-acetyltransferase